MTCSMDSSVTEAHKERSPRGLSFPFRTVLNSDNSLCKDITESVNDLTPVQAQFAFSSSPATIFKHTSMVGTT